MFVNSNSYDAVRKHYTDRLSHKFSDREIRSILFEVIRTRMKDPSLDAVSIQDLRFSESDLLYFRDVRNKLLTNEPVQYVLGSVHFYNLDLLIDKRALIPRPETEELVDWVVQTERNPGIIIDFCSGSGCIALSLKSKYPQANIITVEKSTEAISLIRENVGNTGLDLDIAEIDVLDPSQMATLTEKADVIVSNPPYVLESDREEMELNVLEYEPEMALFVSDDDPLIFYRALAKDAKNRLNPGGSVYFEIHEKYGTEVLALLRDIGFVNIELRKDLQGRDRMVRGNI